MKKEKVIIFEKCIREITSLTCTNEQSLQYKRFKGYNFSFLKFLSFIKAPAKGINPKSIILVKFLDLQNLQRVNTL